MNRTDFQLVLHDVPVFLWFFGLIFAGVGTLVLREGRVPAMGFILVAIGLGVLLFPSILTVTADRITRTLKLEYRSALRHTLKEVSFDEIAGINVERSTSHSRGSFGFVYRVVLKRKDGQLIPFHPYSSSGSGRKERQVRQLRDFIGVQGFDTTPPLYAALQSQAAEIRETDGVRWQIKPIAMGSSVGACWFSPDFKTPGVFLFVAQKAEGQASGSLLASLGSMFFRQSISMYGFQAEDTPGIDQAAALSPLDPPLEPHFMAFTNAPDSGRQILNSRAVTALAGWAGRYPLKQFQRASHFSQLVMLIGPQGIYVAISNLSQPDHVNELTTLGVEVVKSRSGWREISSSAF
jgi:hypothetical protein